MKAVIQNEFGGPEVLHYRDVDGRKPGDFDVVVEVKAVGVNPGLDFPVREGRYVRPVSLPHVLGLDPAGVVIEAGGGVSDRKPGDRVWVDYLIGCGACGACQSGNKVACADNQMISVSRWGGYAEQITVPAGNVLPVPDGIDFAQACVLARHFPTAMFLLEQRAKLNQGEWVLVTGASGGLGNACVQIAKAMGAKVIAGAGSKQRVAAALGSGADFGVDYASQDLEKQVMEMTGGAGIAVLCDNVGDPNVWPKAFNCLAKNGRVVSAGARGGKQVVLDMTRLYTRRISIIGGPGTVKDGVARAFEMAVAGKVHPVIGHIMPLSAAADAHRGIDKRELEGKVILRPER